jgi:hypothetical protein
MRELLLLVACLLPEAAAAPEYFASVANQALRLRGGALLGGDLHVRAVAELEQQVKRVMGADPGLELNVTALRDRPDTELLRILFLAVLGNYTSAASQDWNRPCSLVVDPQTGLVALHEPDTTASLSLKVVVVLLVAVQLQRKLAETRRAAEQEHANASGGKKT